MFENPTIESNIIEVGQVVPEICHFLYSTAAILDIEPCRCLKMCSRVRFLFSLYPNIVKSITISLWASDSYGNEKSIHGGLHYIVHQNKKRLQRHSFVRLFHLFAKMHKEQYK